MQPSKCHFCLPQVKYLSHIVSADRIQPDPAKLEAVTKCPTPRNIEELRALWGLLPQICAKLCTDSWSIVQSYSEKYCRVQWQELFAIVAAASTWGHHWSGLRIHFHCDNLPIVQAWARQSSKHPDLMQLLRTLFLVAAQNNFTIRMSHLPGRLNRIADALSRNNLPMFFTLAPQAAPLPTLIPYHLTRI